MRRASFQIARFEKAVYLLLILGLVSVVAFGTLVRYTPITGIGMAWTEEIGRMLFVWIVFLAAGWCHRDGSHFALSLVVDRLGFRARMLLSILSEMLTLAFFITIGVLAVQYSIDQFQVRTPVLRWPLSLFYIPLVLAMSMVFVQGIIRLMKQFLELSIKCQT